jgi:outer membrane protein
MRKNLGFRLRSAVAASVLMTGIAVPALQAETLADAMAYGYENSGLLDQNRALLRAADEDVAQAVGALMPVLNWQAQAQFDYPESPFANISVGNKDLTANLFLSASLTLYDGGLTRYGIDSQKETVLATRFGLLQIEQQVLLAIVQAYMDVLQSYELVNVREANVRLITQELRAARDRFEVGEVTRTDVAQAEAQLAGARSDLAFEQGALVRAIEAFKAAVGREPRNLQPVAVANIRQSVAEAKSIALQSHPALLQAQHQVSAAEINILRAQSAMNPTVSLTARAGVDEVFDQVATLGVQVTGPIYQGGRLSSQVRQFIAYRDAARGDLLTTARQIEQNVGNAYSYLDASKARLDASDRQVRAATVAFEGVREEATLGARTTLDVLDAEQELLDARTNQISAQIEEVLASYSLLATMGLLTAQALSLNVQIYDPTAYYNLVDDAPTVTSEQGRALDRVLQAIGD